MIVEESDGILGPCSLGQMTDQLRNFLEPSLPKVKDGKKPNFSLGLAKPKLGSHILEETIIPCQSNEFVLQLLHGVRFHRFIDKLKAGDLEKAQLGLGHSYCKAKVKFNVNLVDSMVIQAIFLLYTIDKEVNTISMRVWLKVLFISRIETNCLENRCRCGPSNKRLLHRLKGRGWRIWASMGEYSW